MALIHSALVGFNVFCTGIYCTGIYCRGIYCRGIAAIAFWAFCLTQPCAHALEPFKIIVVDQQNHWPVPLIELRTTHHVSLVTDNAGIIAVDLPELMGQETWFTVEGHGYSVPTDGFGFRGVRLTPTPGGSATLEVQRQLPAKRLGRITGAGLFAESQQLGLEQAWRDQGVMGCDSLQSTIHDGRLIWLWGDTTLARYPLGRFHMTGATTALQPIASFEPPLRLRYDYFRDVSRQVRNVAQMPGSGPTWLNGLCSLPDRSGKQRMVATYSKIKPPLTVYELGLCEWNERRLMFEKLVALWKRSDDAEHPAAVPQGHVTLWHDQAGKACLLFGDPFPSLKCPATYEDWQNPASWEAIEPQEQVRARDRPTQIRPHRGSIAWNNFRQKWVVVFNQHGGEASFLGELWYAEANSPLGPWEDALQVVTHNNYSFYNPRLHPELTSPDSPVLLFEATYTKAFSSNPQATPRYDYNQVLYRLDLDEL